MSSRGFLIVWEIRIVGSSEALELGAWSLGPGAWSLEPGAWSLEWALPMGGIKVVN